MEANNYPLSKLEEIFSHLLGSLIYIDLSDACLQVEVNDDLKKLLAIDMHKGLCQTASLQNEIRAMKAVIPGIRSFIADTIQFLALLGRHTQRLIPKHNGY